MQNFSQGRSLLNGSGERILFCYFVIKKILYLLKNIYLDDELYLCKMIYIAHKREKESNSITLALI